MLHARKTDRDRAMLLVIDLQTKLLPLIGEHERVVNATGKLIRGARLFDLPILASVQYVKGLGPIHDPVARLLGDADVRPLEKSTFSVWADEALKRRLIEIDRPQVIVAGIETHVCVQRTVLDLLVVDYQVLVCADAVGSRFDLDRETALARMQQAGAIVTTVESALFELCHDSATDRFRKLLEIVK